MDKDIIWVTHNGRHIPIKKGMLGKLKKKKEQESKGERKETRTEQAAKLSKHYGEIQKNISDVEEKLGGKEDNKEYEEQKNKRKENLESKKEFNEKTPREREKAVYDKFNEMENDIAEAERKLGKKEEGNDPDYEREKNRRKENLIKKREFSEKSPKDREKTIYSKFKEISNNLDKADQKLNTRPKLKNESDIVMFLLKRGYSRQTAIKYAKEYIQSRKK